MGPFVGIVVRLRRMTLVDYVKLLEDGALFYRTHCVKCKKIVKCCSVRQVVQFKGIVLIFLVLLREIVQFAWCEI